MYLVYIYDSRNKETDTLEYLLQWAFTTKNVVKSIEMNDGIPVNFEHIKTLKVLSYEAYRAPIIIDTISAKYNPELFMQKNDIVVLLPHEMDRTTAINEINPFTEEQAVGYGAKFMYTNSEYFEERNKKLMSVIDIGKATDFSILDEWINKYKTEHLFYPSFFVSRKDHKQCVGRRFLLMSLLLNGTIPNSRILSNLKLTENGAKFPVDTQTLDLSLLNVVIKDRHSNKTIPLQIKI